jgi:hypothetical protein
LAALNLFQGVYYVEITENRPQNRKFAAGWMKRLLMPAEVL